MTKYAENMGLTAVALLSHLRTTTPRNRGVHRSSADSEHGRRMVSIGRPATEPKDPEIAAWNAEVDRRKAEKQLARSAKKESK